MARARRGALTETDALELADALELERRPLADTLAAEAAAEAAALEADAAAGARRLLAEADRADRWTDACGELAAAVGYERAFVVAW